MHLLRITDAVSFSLRTGGVDIPHWAATALQEAGFDLARQILYRYDAHDQSTLFLQGEGWGDGGPQQHFDTEYSSPAAWEAGVDAFMAEWEQRGKEVSC